MRYKPRRTHRNRKRKAIDDWESFFYAMCFLNDIQIFDDEVDFLDETGQNQKYYEAKRDIVNIYVNNNILYFKIL